MHIEKMKKMAQNENVPLVSYSEALYPPTPTEKGHPAATRMELWSETGMAACFDTTPKVLLKKTILSFLPLLDNC